MMQKLTENELMALVKPLPTARYEVDFGWRYLNKTLRDFENDYGGLDLTPDYQRGHVWAPEQQRAYIENVMRGVVSTAGMVIQFNCRNWHDADHVKDSDLPVGFQCIDGLQRLTAVTEYMAGNVMPFGRAVEEWDGTNWDTRRIGFRLKFAVYDFQYRYEVLDHYLALNAGGTPHSPEEIERVRALRAAAQR
ncbi:hypothetical protein WJ96_05365 [Burkholderia ubonensis]|uniref:GmrSD restriction endonucleases N-terminal domain-containing protein n=3 Tax=Burkholderia ubonensis TaxID=101571 RepID=A0AAW3MXS5_9BURK|nr:hypothetical protein WJ96_05365 [Burkholderia ubonensis]KVZ93113.1 hypothetical protein WL25_17025 [Burkholderia ubonensis]